MQLLYFLVSCENQAFDLEASLIVRVSLTNQQSQKFFQQAKILKWNGQEIIEETSRIP